jgi:hypothetical protein
MQWIIHDFAVIQIAKLRIRFLAVQLQVNAIAS